MLDVCRQRSKNLDALNGNEFAQLVKADFGLTASDHVARWSPGFMVANFDLTCSEMPSLSNILTR
jgi:hypothetical protein